MLKKQPTILYVFLAVLAAIILPSMAAYATHSWGGYHWANNSSSPFTLKLGDNVASTWDIFLNGASSDWSKSLALDTTVVPGATKPKVCKASSGRVEVCNSAYGNNGWLGIASVWVSGGHITQGVVKMNDTYFKTATYNTPAWRALVMCQEVGHTLGLDHQDEDFNNPPLGTCMDYTSNPTPNQHPNAHDYEMLDMYIYLHTDSTTTVAQSTAPAAFDINHDDPGTWGQLQRTSQDNRLSIYMRDFGNGRKIFTFVIWVR